MVESLDPIILQEWGGIQREGMIYLGEILKSSGYDKKQIDQLIYKLVFHFPTHGYVIHRDHAKALGIKVEFDDEDDDAWKKMRYWLSKYVVRQTDRHFVRYVVPKKAREVKKSSKTAKEIKTTRVEKTRRVKN